MDGHPNPNSNPPYFALTRHSTRYSQWKSELEKCTAPGRLAVATHLQTADTNLAIPGARKALIDELAAADVVLTTYAMIELEAAGQRRRGTHRIVLNRIRYVDRVAEIWRHGSGVSHMRLDDSTRRPRCR
jgi:hypothetical protein